MRHNKRRWTVMLAILLAFSVVIAGCGKDESKEANKEQDPAAELGKPLDTTSKKIVAEYEGGKVTEGELNLYLNILQFLQPNVSLFINDAQAKKQLVKQLIGERMIAAKVKEDESYAKQADKVMKEIEDYLKSQSKEKSFEASLKERGFNKEQLREFLINGNKVSSYFEKQVKEEDLKKEYNKPDQFVSVKVQHILISTENRSDAEAKKRAEEVKRKLDKGGDFGKLAKEYSDDPGSKEQGGVIEGLSDQFVPEFAKAARTLPLNKLSEPIKTDYGYHVMKVSERKKLPYKEVKDQLKQDQVQKLYQSFVEKNVKLKKLDLPEEKNEKQ
ncbi:foldase protein PrsA [Planifilum fimeticola]|jgi:foldase protein PrsA|uniref:Foldase protein PrsA n=1 Tax=Planifilum fimeticola TaxID=201975 RepID=A0A2T0LDH3_9BACL|nr:peptidylprolyl isomerase [Planifilum fimeticola]PRX39889.1 foldase protein PrsA [Planifilum fimeticola]